MTLVHIGIGLSFVAMLCWGFGDFMIQRSTRQIGDWETLFIISLLGSVVLLPFVYRDLISILSQAQSLIIMFTASAVIFFAALLEFESLKIGKIAVIEPILSLEIISSAFLAFFVLQESISLSQTIFIILLMLGLMLVALKDKHVTHKVLFEKGIAIAFFGALIMGAANFFVGWGSRMTNSLVMNFFLSVFLTVVTCVYLVSTGRAQKAFRDIRTNRKLLLPMSVADNIAWVAFAFSMSLAPVAVAVALSESYIIIAVLLGLVVGKEKLQMHQKTGLVVAVVSATILAGITM